MKIKVYIKRINKELRLPKIIAKGEWIDLMASEMTKFNAPQSGTLKTRKVGNTEEKYRNVSFDTKLIPLGVAMKLPEGFEAHILPRSSTAKGFGLVCGNSQGVVDSSYCGNDDEWKFSAIAIRETTINMGERICQFRIELSQKATIWQKIKWLLSNGIEIVEVDNLSDNNRSGFGSTGVN
jgi:dUTP pyrophosphatase